MYKFLKFLNFIDYINTMLIHIISLRSLLRFNPFGVISLRSERKFGASGAHFPQVAPVAIHIQPLWGYLAERITAFGTLIRYQQNPL
jgi:hypothetical protein